MGTAALHMGFLESFKGSDCLLLHGEQPALQRLATLLDQLASGRDVSIKLHETPEVIAHAVELTVVRADDRTGLRRQGNKFVWRRNTQTLRMYARQIQCLADEGQGHVYLEGTNQDHPVVVSCNEYGSIFERTDA